jgi:hypothetical protein
MLLGVAFAPGIPAPNSQAAALLAAMGAHAFLGGLERRMVDLLARFARVVEYLPGTLIGRAGEEQHALYLLTRGEVELQGPQRGRRVAPVERLGAGDALGTERTPQRWREDVRAVDEVTAIVMDDANLDEQMDRDAEVRPALKMCAVRYAYMRDLQKAAKNHGRA